MLNIPLWHGLRFGFYKIDTAPPVQKPRNDIDDWVERERNRYGYYPKTDHKPEAVTKRNANSSRKSGTMRFTRRCACGKTFHTNRINQMSCCNAGKAKRHRASKTRH